MTQKRLDANCMRCKKRKTLHITLQYVFCHKLSIVGAEHVFFVQDIAAGGGNARNSDTSSSSSSGFSRQGSPQRSVHLHQLVPIFRVIFRHFNH